MMISKLPVAILRSHATCFSKSSWCRDTPRKSPMHFENCIQTIFPFTWWRSFRKYPVTRKYTRLFQNGNACNTVTPIKDDGWTGKESDENRTWIIGFYAHIFMKETRTVPATPSTLYGMSNRVTRYSTKLSADAGTHLDQHDKMNSATRFI